MDLIKAAINELELNGARTTNSTEIAEGFTKFFAEIGSDLSRDIEVGASFYEFVNQTSSCFSFQRLTQLQVLSHLNKLCKTKATGSTDELLRMVNWIKLDRQRLVDKSLMMCIRL